MFDNIANSLRCDDATKITILEMEQKEIQAYHAQDFELLKNLSQDLIVVRSIGF